MDLLFPDVRIARLAPRGIDNSARFMSPLSGAVRTVSRPGDRWAFRADFENLTAYDRARLEAVIAMQRGAANRLLFSPLADFNQRGSFSAPELMPYNDFGGDLTGWTSSGATLSINDQMLRVQNSAAAPGRATAPGVAVTAGLCYVARAIALPGSQNAWRFTCGTTAGAFDIFNVSVADAGIWQVAFIAASSFTASLSLYCNSANAGDYVPFTFLSLHRGIAVNGAQTGSLIKVDALPPSTTGLLLPGDWFSCSMELKRVVAPLNSDSSGNGVLQFAPPLRSPAIDNDGLVLSTPFGRFILSNSESGWETTPGKFATSSYDLTEAP